MTALDSELLLRAYTIGVFPMSDSRDAESVFWVEPKRRAILPLDSFHLSKSLRKLLRSGTFAVTRDRAFDRVVGLCAARPETWINAEIETAYGRLHRAGCAHSIEVWEDDELAGGLYGVRLGGAFFGESMVSLRPNASKIALAWLVARLRVGGFRLLDCQFMTPHLESLGAIEINQTDYLTLLDSALDGRAGAGGATGVGGAEPAAFDALDRLLGAAAADGGAAGVPPAGCVIAQLIGQTS